MASATHHGEFSPDDFLVTPAPPWALPRFAEIRELAQHRELLGMLVWRHLAVRYKQTAFGIAWAILQPLAIVVIFSVFLGQLAGIGAKLPGEVPYFLHTLCGLVPWQGFSAGLSTVARSLTAERPLLTKVYFPRVLVPLAPALAALVDVAVAAGVLTVLLAVFGYWPGLGLLWLPVFIVWLLLATLGVGLGLSAVNGLYRDVEHTLPLLTQCWLFLSPIAYATSFVPPGWRLLYAVNPLVGIVEGFRAALLGMPLQTGVVLVSLASTLVLLVVGGLVFRAVEPVLIDRV